MTGSQLQKYHGGPTRKSNYIERFWSKVKSPVGIGECWEWLASSHAGYGCFKVSGKVIEAHKLAYEIVNGKVANGKNLHHLCMNTLCCNPYHLQPVTQLEHMGTHKRLREKEWRVRT